MNSRHDPLTRLFEAAAALTPPEPGDLPYALACRLRAGLRSLRRSGDAATLLPLLRAGLAAACGFLLLSAALSVRALERSAGQELAPAWAAVNLALTE